MNEQVKVWDIFVRVFHWALAALMGIAYISEDFLTLHAYAGYIILFLLAGRVLWGFIGTRHARFSDFIYPPEKIYAFLKDMAQMRHARYLGHNPAAGAALMLIMGSIAVTAFTGIVAYGVGEKAGPLSGMAAYAWRFGKAFEEVHEFFAWTTMALIGVHVAAVVLESIHYRENLAASMISGYKAKEIGKETL